MGNHGLSIGTTWQRCRRTTCNPPDGRLQPLEWDDKGMGMSRRHSISVTCYFACCV